LSAYGDIGGGLLGPELVTKLLRESGI